MSIAWSDHDELPDLSGVSLFAGLSVESRRRIAGELRLLSVEAGQIVVAQGDPSRDVYVVLSGGLVGLLLSESGKAVSFSEIGAGNYFGEIAALDRRPRSITISAVVRSRLGRLSGDALRRWMQAEPTLAINLASDLAERIRILTDQAFGLVVHDVDTRVRILLSRLAQSRNQLVPDGVIAPAPTHEAMAGRIGANREAVSRVISRLVREGTIEASRQRIVLRNVAAILDGL
jgi:CRP/FNR family cyclic AMP-dependent transcriptional regulator